VTLAFERARIRSMKSTSRAGAAGAGGLRATAQGQAATDRAGLSQGAEAARALEAARHPRRNDQDHLRRTLLELQGSVEVSIEGEDAPGGMKKGDPRAALLKSWNGSQPYSAASFTSVPQRGRRHRLGLRTCKVLLEHADQRPRGLVELGLVFQVLTGLRISLARPAARSEPQSRNICRAEFDIAPASRRGRRSTAHASP